MRENIELVSEKFLETETCPFCQQETTSFVKKIQEPCNCFWNREPDKIFLVFQCSSCLNKYKIQI